MMHPVLPIRLGTHTSAQLRALALIDFIGYVTVFPGQLEVQVSGAPPLKVLLSEVEFKVLEIVSIEGPT
jgi:hypothetical protein